MDSVTGIATLTSPESVVGTIQVVLYMQLYDILLRACLCVIIIIFKGFKYLSISYR